MSYAGRLVAMSRGEVPRVAPMSGAESEPVREEHVEAVSSPPPATATAAARELPDRHTPVASIATPERERASEIHTHVDRTREIVTAPANPQTPPPIELHVHEVSPVAERVVLPAPPPWLAEDPTASDPLVATAETDELRELMRSVRQWTASAPTIIETQAPPAQAQARPAIEAPPAAEPVQVSIGNIVVTVEDAPASTQRGPSPSPARSIGDRLARNYIRGT